MGTKNNPGSFDCYANADNDEPMFVLLGRDKQAPKLVRDWAYGRLALVKSGAKPLAHLDKAIEAFRCADDMETWQAVERINSLKERLSGAYEVKQRDVDYEFKQQEATTKLQPKDMPEQISDPSLPITSMRNRRTPAVTDPYETGANVAVPRPWGR